MTVCQNPKTGKMTDVFCGRLSRSKTGKMTESEVPFTVERDKERRERVVKEKRER